MCTLPVIYKTSEQVALGMYAKYAWQPSETPSKQRDVSTSVPTPVPKQTLPEETPLWEDLLLPVVCSAVAKEHE